jgi:thiamine biosynthesis lipoprotein
LKDSAEPAPAPDADAVREALDCCGFSRQVMLVAAQRSVQFRRAGVRIDPGALGKGWALDRAARLLREAGVERALLHGGTSSVLALGAPQDSAGWRVVLRDPDDGGQVLAAIFLKDGALGVSAPHGQRVQRGGRMIGHLLDPRTGQPAKGARLAAVAVRSAADADALSTALLVEGRLEAEWLAEGWPDAAALLVADAVPRTVHTHGTLFERMDAE